MVEFLNLINPETEKPQSYILRYWEKEFKIVKPKKINNRRYYTSKQLEILKMIKFLLKNKGLTILGVKKLMDSNVNKLDDYNNHSLKTVYYKNYLRLKSKKLLDKIKRIKNYGKKNSS